VGFLVPFLGTFIGKLLTSYALNAITNKLFGAKQKSSQSQSPTYSFGALQTQANNTLVMPLVYGKVKMAGNDIWASAEGTTQSRLIGFGFGKISGFEDIRLNDIDITTLGNVNYSTYVGDGVQQIDKRVTGTTQTDKAKLVGGLKYDAYLAVTATANDRLNGNYNVTTVVKGRLVRIYTNPSTYTVAWSDNPAWCILDFMIHYNGCATRIEDIDIQSFIDSAVYCDELIALADGTTQKRFTLNLAIDEKKSKQDWLDEMLIVCQGYKTYNNGKHGILIDKPAIVSQIFDIQKDEDLQLEWADINNVLEKVQITYLDPAYKWAKVGAVATWGTFQNRSPISKIVEMYGVTNFNQASRLALFYLKQTQTCRTTYIYKTNKRAINRTIGDVVEINDPIRQIQGIKCRIMAISNSQDDTIILTMNEYNENLYADTLGSIAPTVYTTSLPNPASVVSVANVSIEEYFKEADYGRTINILELSWVGKEYNYKEAEVYIYDENNSISMLGSSLNNLEFNAVATNTSIWKLINKGADRVYVSNLTKGVTYKLKIVAINSYGIKEDFDTATVIEHKVIGKTLTPSTPSGLFVNITDKCEWHWNVQEENVDFWELRSDENAGNEIGLYLKSQNNKNYFTPPSRFGKVFLYAHNRNNFYSSPCILEYNKVAPVTPTNVTIADIFQGVIITCDSLPAFCVGINVHINDGTGDKVYFSPNNSYTFKTTGGIFDIQISYVDIFGEGEKTTKIQKVIQSTINPALLSAESISLDKMDADIKTALIKAQNTIDIATLDSAIAEIKQETDSISATVATKANLADLTITNNSIASVVTDLQTANTTIVQNTNDIQLRATSADLISLINVSPETISLKSKLVHIAGDTLIEYYHQNEPCVYFSGATLCIK